MALGCQIERGDETSIYSVFGPGGGLYRSFLMIAGSVFIKPVWLCVAVVLAGADNFSAWSVVSGAIAVLVQSLVSIILSLNFFSMNLIVRKAESDLGLFRHHPGLCHHPTRQQPPNHTAGAAAGAHHHFRFFARSGPVDLRVPKLFHDS